MLGFCEDGRHKDMSEVAWTVQDFCIKGFSFSSLHQSAPSVYQTAPKRDTPFDRKEIMMLMFLL
eukprot:6250479-Amphidinium_carterae.1